MKHLKITNAILEKLLQDRDKEVLELKLQLDKVMNFSKVLIQKNEYQKMILADCERNCPFFQKPTPPPN